MSAPVPLSPLSTVFREALHCAITAGRLDPRAGSLGSQTHAALQAIASDHPEASTDLINDAYNAWECERTRSNGAVEPACDRSGGREALNDGLG